VTPITEETLRVLLVTLYTARQSRARGAETTTRSTRPADELTREVRMSTTEIAELRRTIGQLRQCVGALRSRYGDASAVRRLANDVDRLDIDAGDLDQAPPVPPQAKPADRSNVVVVPDTPYDPSLWQDADDEGVGGYQRDQR
jgi:hypothetical protein